MDDGLLKRLNNPKYKNWLKVSISLLYTKDALHDFTREVINSVHGDIKKRAPGGGCVGQCNTGKGKVPTCSTCSQWVQEIKSYNKGLLNWKNSEPTKWHSHPWEIAKCFMNPQGSKSTAAMNTGPNETDVSGILNLIINCKEFAKNRLKEKNAPVRVLQVRNKVMHSSAMQFTDDEMKDHIQTIIDLLQDEKELNTLDVCKENVTFIESLRDEDFVISKEAESECVEDLLRCYKMLLECGQNVDNDVKKSLENISNFIKDNKDLQSKFDSKLAQFTNHFQNITDSLDSRISSCEISNGQMRGKIEYLENKISQFERSGGPINVINHEKCLLKIALQCYTQKRKLGLPMYVFDKNDSGEFMCTVSVGDEVFKSNHAKPTKKEAEQCAAEAALSYFSNETHKNSLDNTYTNLGFNQPSNEIILNDSKDRKKSFKNLLQEYAQKERHILPIYDTKQREDGNFTSMVFFNGQWFTPSVSQGKKIDAEQAAAEFALSCIQEGSCARKSDVGGSRDSGTLDNMITLATTSAESCTGPDDMEAKDNTSQSKTKSYKSLLNEYCQKSNITAAKYVTVSTEDGMFTSSVTVNDSVYESETSKSNKRKSEEFAATIACQRLKLASEDKLNAQLPDATNLEPQVTGTTIIADGKHQKAGETINDVIVDGGVSSSPAVASTAPKKSHKNILQEYCQKMGESVPEYTSDEVDKGKFISSVKAIGIVYKSEVTMASKRLSREHAAMIACCYLLNIQCAINPQISPRENRENQDNENEVSIEPTESSHLTVDGECFDNSKHPISAAEYTTNCESITSDVGTETDGGTETVKHNSGDSAVIAQEKTQENITSESVSSQQLTNPENDFTANTKDPGSHVSNPPNKSYKSILNEHCQKIGLVARYETEKLVDDNLFVSCLTVGGDVFNGAASTSKKQSKENIAKVACLQLNIGIDHSETVDSKTQNTAVECDETTTPSSITCKNTLSTGMSEKTTSEVPETDFVGLLIQYTTRNKLPAPVFVTKAVEGSSEFSSRVLIGKRCFRGEKANKIKMSKRHAARSAIDVLTNERESVSAIHVEKTLKEYHRSLGEEIAWLPEYKIMVSGDERCCAQVTIAKKWEITLEGTRPSKKEVEKTLAEMALRELGENMEHVPVAGEKSVMSRLHEFCQLQQRVPKPRYNVTGEDAVFSGDLTFYTVKEYESLSPQPSENKARISAAMSACNDLSLE